VLTLHGPSDVRRGADLKDLQIIEDGSVLIRDGKIASVGPTRRIENMREARAAPEIELENAIIMPGFVDPGVHLPLGLRDRVKSRQRLDFRAETLALLKACMQHGTLNLRASVSGGNGDPRAGISALRQLASITNSPVGTVPSWRVPAEPAHDNGSVVPYEFATALKILANRKLAQFIELTPESSQALGDDCWRAARSSNLDVNLLWPGGSPHPLGTLLARIKPATVSCACCLSGDERSALADSQAISILSNGVGVLEQWVGDAVRRLIDSGAAVALSSGYDAEEAPTFNMQTALALAVLRLHLSTEEAITAATINAAHAIGQGHVVGSLECGKRADLLVLNVPDYREIPRRFGINNVVMAIREGNLVYNRTRWKVRTT
jgi:imidazolonepropionase